MFLQALTVSLRLVFFRGGPQDFPFSETRELSYACVAIALLANLLAASVAVPVLVGLPTALIIVASYAFTARSALKSRGLMNRYAQTLNALLATNALLTLAMIPALMKVSPQIIAFYHQLEQNPDLLSQADPWPKLDTLSSLALDVLFLWQFAVSAFIFRQAANVTMFVGIMLVLLVGVVMMGISFLLSLLAAIVPAS